MKAKVSVFAVVLFLTACSGGGGSAPAAVPTGSASGTVLDGLILNGTVTAYDYSNGAKGAVLGQATTNTTDGTYSLSIQAESRPILLEITGGYYNEEMDPTTNIPLDTGDKMQAVINYTTGASITTSITAYTTAAAGLAAYEIKKGTAVATAIDDANKRFSNFVGLDIIKTVPLEITDIANASATLTPSLQYGFLAGGISMWVYNNVPSGVTALQKPYISIKFVQLMYQDVAADGLLDGMATDSAGTPVQLSFGTVPLTPTVYRQGLGVSMLQIADNANNKTGLKSSNLLPYGEAYAGSTDPMWAGVPPQPISSPTIAITAPKSNQWVGAQGNLTASVQDYIGLSSETLALDGNPVSTITTNLATPNIPFSAAGLSGTHTLALTATNTAGLSTTQEVPVMVDTSAPSISQLSMSTSCAVAGFASDAGSGVEGTTATFAYNSGTYSTTSVVTNGTVSFPTTIRIGALTSIVNGISIPYTITVMDTTGNATVHSGSIYESTKCKVTLDCTAGRIVSGCSLVN